MNRHANPMLHANSMLPVLLLTLILATGCGNERPTEPVLPLTVSELWPNADGNSWTYALTSTNYELDDPRVYPHLEDLPPCPPLADLYADLGQAPAAKVTRQAERILRLRFQGQIALGPGLVVQHLVSSLDGGDDGDSQPFPLRGGPWHADDHGIVEYSYHGDTPDTTWVHLTDDLSPGSTCVFQVCHMISCNTCEHVSVWRRLERDVADHGTTDCLEVFYLFEWGVSVATDEDGEIVGYYRRYVYGTVTYARDIGPIRCRQRMVMAGSNLLDRTKVIDTVANLVAHDVVGR